jgi:hypothetical protein
MPPPNLPKRRSSWPATVLVLVLLSAAAWLLIAYRQPVLDRIRAAQFEPTAAVKALASDLKLTDSGSLYFEASQPQVEAQQAFNDGCGQQHETNNPILGCYVRQQIYIYDVTNSKLRGIEQTTAAHELLHAVYERMGVDEKRQLNAELEQAYQKLKTPELSARMEYYKKTEPGERLNELHSILGTEFSHLGPVLENHYAQYFTDRASLVGYYRDYHSVFASVTSKLKSLAAKINALVTSINRRIAAYNADVAALNRDSAAYSRRQFTSQAEADSEYQALTSRQGSLDATRAGIEQDIAYSNTLRSLYNRLVKENDELNRSINSSLSPKPSL